MHYEDLTFYRDDGSDTAGFVNVYPKVLNVGWLDRNYPYTKGDIPQKIIQKLKELTFLDMKNSEDKKHGIFEKNKAVIIHLMHMRGAPYKCSLCGGEVGEITINPGGLDVYQGTQQMLLGRSEMCIPDSGGDLFYSFPTMLYHYVVDHQYCPPADFLKAVDQFNMHAPYNIEKEQDDLECLQMPVDQLHDIDRQQGVINKSIK
ncbi:hypothetical protein HNQ59_003900 [Chitinivorax tropicus]|uniref:DUF7919 domain-containing protein n=1 Tax=Chitinivorax tropicus TaxID=714531 RepID=A0A840MU19_9PROT|nr:hypothetical protein [Chitinivorax tropicus]MBB5020579.1 hypothetical protein [Chitinivorax tropicus]